MTTDAHKPGRKAQLDALLLKLPLRLPVAVARELQFSRGDVASFQPGGVTSTREWIQIERANADDYEKDLPLFQASIEFVAGRTR